MSIKQEQIIIDYDGANIKHHQMDINDFVVSTGGCADLLTIIANELKIPKEAIKITIGPLEQGSLKSVIFVSILTYAASNFTDGMGVDKILNKWGEEFLTFIQTKRDSKIDSASLPQHAIEATDIQGRLLQRKDTHQAVYDIVKCLNYDAEKITIEIPNQKKSEELTRDNVSNLMTNPFGEPLEKNEEQIEEVYMTLFLENVGITSTEWTFYEKKDNKKTKRITADVLDTNLLMNARNSSLEQEYKNVPLICKVKIKTLKKAGALRTSPPSYYILECRKDMAETLF
ncbi:MAG: hypothetical protein E7007_04550 [Alphaproteobacteria bacterium]|nr:hypothetical protein [Alphaproteobacteria bacterium]